MTNRHPASIRRAAALALLLAAPLAYGAPSTADDRLSLGFNGESLTGTNGGGGGALGWIHNFSDSALAGVGVEHQALANSHWTFGSINGAYTFGPGDRRYTFYGDAHEGGGNSGNRSLQYHIETVGAVATFDHRLSLQLEDKQFYVDTVSGNLPKVGVSYLWNPHLQTGLAYAYSAGSNLGTRLTSGRIDVYEPLINFLGGFSYGQATAAVLSYVGTPVQTSVPGLRLKEGYVGATLPLPRIRSEVSVILDYQDLSSRLVHSRRIQGNLNYVLHIGHHGS
jgi:hypothetical protein